MKSKLWQRVGQILAAFIIVTLIFPVTALPTTAAEPKPKKIHPVLEEAIQTNPDAEVRVIVKGNNKDNKLDSKLSLKGVLGKKKLPLAKSISGKLKGKDIKELAEDTDVQWITYDAPMVPSADISDVATDYPFSVNADDVWTGSTQYMGKGVGVAVIDSGIKHDSKDFDSNDLLGILLSKDRVIAKERFNEKGHRGVDRYGHGTHVAGIIASSGKDSKGKYIGIAPGANLIDVKVSDEEGMAYMSDVIESLQWVMTNKDKYNIRVANMSLVSSIAEPYQYSPLDAAVEAVWLSGIAVVVSSGNLGANSMYYAPANDPFVITVGALDTNGTSDPSDDSIPSWSSFGVTQDGYSKPDVVAPGRKIISSLAPGSIIGKQFSERVVDKKYISLSGTSMAAPMVSGVAALAFEAHPDWTPDQFKSALISTARPVGGPAGGAGLVDALAIVSTTAPGYANMGVPLNAGIASVAGIVTYDAATWNAATWNAATWNAATWNAATWNAATWNAATWNAATWNAATWNATTWNAVADD